MESKIVQCIIISIVIDVQAVHIAFSYSPISRHHLVRLHPSRWWYHRHILQCLGRHHQKIHLSDSVRLCCRRTDSHLLRSASGCQAWNIDSHCQDSRTALWISLSSAIFSAVLLAVTQARLVDPRASNATAVIYKTGIILIMQTYIGQNSTPNYVILLWIICVPGSYFLSHIHASYSTAEASKGNNNDELPKVQYSEIIIQNWSSSSVIFQNI